MYVFEAKTKAQISFAVTAKLICAFVFAYAKSWFSHGTAHMSVNAKLISIFVFTTKFNSSTFSI